MSLDLVMGIFIALSDCKEWHAHLLSFTHSKRNGTTYNCRRIELEPSERLSRGTGKGSLVRTWHQGRI